MSKNSSLADDNNFWEGIQKFENRVHRIPPTWFAFFVIFYQQLNTIQDSSF